MVAKTHFMKRTGALIAALVLMFTLFPVSIFAEEPIPEQELEEQIPEEIIPAEPGELSPANETDIPPDEIPDDTTPENPVPETVTESSDPVALDPDRIITPEEIRNDNVSKAIKSNGHAYVISHAETDVFSDPGRTLFVCHISHDGTLFLVDEYADDLIHVWFANRNGSIYSGYIPCSVIDDTVISDDEIPEMTTLWDSVSSDIGTLFLTDVTFPVDDSPVIEEIIPEPADEPVVPMELAPSDETVEVTITETAQNAETIVEVTVSDNTESASVSEVQPNIEECNENPDNETADLDTVDLILPIDAPVVPLDDAPVANETVEPKEIISEPAEEIPVAEISDKDSVENTAESEQDMPDEVVPNNEPEPIAPEDEPNTQDEPVQSEIPDETEPVNDFSDEMPDEILSPAIIEELPWHVGDHIYIAKGTPAYKSTSIDTPEGTFGHDGIVTITEVVPDESGTIWLKVLYWFGEDEYSGEIRYYNELQTCILAEDSASTDAAENSLTVVQPAKKKALMAIGPSKGFTIDLSKLMEGNHVSTALVVDSSKFAMRADGGGKWRAFWNNTTGEFVYADRYYYNSNGSYILYCIEPTKDQPPTGSSGWLKYTNSNSNLYSGKVLKALKWVLRNGAPFRYYDGDAEATQICTQLAIRQVLIDLAGVDKPKDDMSTQNYTDPNRTDGTITTSNWQKYLAYAKWLAAKAEEAASFTGIVTLSSKSDMTKNGSTYTGSVKITVDGDYYRIPKSSAYTITGTSLSIGANTWPVSTGSYGYSANYYYGASGDTITVSTTSPSVSFSVESFSTGDEVRIQEYTPLGSQYQTLASSVLAANVPDAMKKETVSFTYVPPNGNLKIVKKDDSGKLMKDVKFTLTASGFSKTATTDSSGVAEFKDVPAGSYTLTETVPTGYTVSAASQSIQITAGETSTINITNTQIKGKIQITKTNSVTGKPVAEAKFAIVNSSGTTVATLTTNSSGQATSDLLPYGTYTVKETTTPTGYVTSTFSTTQAITENNKTYTISVTNTPQGAVKIIKTDKDTKAKLKDAAFELYSGSTKVAGPSSTDSNGEVVFSNINPGSYTIKETKAPTGYDIEITDGKTVTVTAGQTATVEITNTLIRGDVRVTKYRKILYDGAKEVPLTGAELVLKKSGTNTVVGQKQTTGPDGTVFWEDIPYGVYDIVELTAPKGYQNEGIIGTVTVNQSHTTFRPKVSNTPIFGSAQLLKKRSDTGAKLQGAEFEILDSTGKARARDLNNNITPTKKTDANGVARWDNLEYGSYFFHEVTPPVGFEKDDTLYPFTVESQDDTVSIDRTNKPIKGKIQITKSDSLTKEMLAGAEFEITRINGIPADNGKNDNIVVAKIKTDKNGFAESPELTYGTYRIREITVPAHYVDSQFSKDIDIHTDGQGESIIYPVSVENEPTKGKIQIIKKDSLDEMPIEGVQFDIYRYEPSKDYIYKTGTVYPIWDVTGNPVLVGSMTTDKNGIATSVSLTKGCYMVKEHANPTGYTAELLEFTKVIVKSDETTEISGTNKPIQGKIRIEKCDELTKEALANAEFTITRISGLPSHKGDNDGETVAVITTNTDGVAESPLLTWGKYQITETKVPEHFVDNAFSIDVTINSDDLKTYTIIAENEPAKGKIQIVKKDALDETPIEGVQFDIFRYEPPKNYVYKTGTVYPIWDVTSNPVLVSSMTTDKDGIAISNPLAKGCYMVKEHLSPTGYTGELLEFTKVIVKSDETTEISGTNKPIQGKIRIEKYDELTKETLANAEFTITRISGLPSHKGSNDGETVAVITTDENGIAESPLLTWGKYKVTETKVPEHFVDNAFSTEVTIDTEDLKTYTIVAENEPTKGWIRLTKTDRQNGNPIEGVQFDIYRYEPPKGYEYKPGMIYPIWDVTDNPVPVTSMTTGKDGVALSEPLTKGCYLVVEHGETAGYLFEEVKFEQVLVHSDEVTDISATNRHVTIQLSIYKRDIDLYDGESPVEVTDSLPRKAAISAPASRGDAVLTGAVFELRAVEDILDYQNNVIHKAGDIVIPTITVFGDQASNTTEELYPGVYEFIELTPPEGYKADPTPVKVNATSAALQSKEAIVEYEAIKTNEVLKGKHGFIKFYGDNQIHTEAGLIENAEPGATFAVYLSKAGSYQNAKEDERDFLTTDEYGRATTKELPYGTYTVQQLKGKPGYALKSPLQIKITGTEDPELPPVTILNNEAIRYRLKIIKTDEETRRVIMLSGTSFKLKDSDGKYVTQTLHYPKETTIDTFTTDNEGTVELPETITYGTYYIEEIVSPEGYTINTESIRIDIGGTDDTTADTHLVEVEVPNKPVKGNIIVDKTGLQLTDFVSITDSFGNNVSKPVYENKYLEGAVFEIRSRDRNVGKDGTVWFEKDQLVDTITTTSTGSDTSKDLPLGNYYLTETSAPKGFVFADQEYDVSLQFEDNKTAKVKAVLEAGNDYLPVEIHLNKIKQSMKADETVTGMVHQTIETVPGEGFVFGLYNKNEIPYRSTVLPADTLVGTGITDTEGKLVLSGYYPHGEYYIRELSAPDGWRINTKTFNISLTPEFKAEADNIIRVGLPEEVFDEIIYYPVTITKTDITGEKTVPGALIEVYNAQNEVIYREYTNENGEIPDIPVVPGTYTFKEILAPEGYELNVAVMKFEVTEDGEIKGETEIRDDYTRVSFMKNDVDGKALPGVEFSLFDKDQHSVMTVLSDENGLVTFEKIPYGTFTILESQPLPGYIPNTTKIQFVVDGTFQNADKPSATLINKPNEVLVQKVDQDGKPLSGATFGLFDSTGAQVMTSVSDDKGIIRFAKVPYGAYNIRETAAPEGYLLSKAIIPVTIDEKYRNSAEPLATVTNQLKRIKYIKTDTSGKYLSGIEFALIDQATGNAVETVTSDENGVFIFTKFDYGDWIIREVKAPDGYNLMEDIHLHVDENWTEPAPFTCIDVPNHYEFVKTDNKGNPLPGVKFTLEDSNGTILRDLVSGDDGVVHVNDLKPGKYIIREIETLEGYMLTDEAIVVVINEKYVVPKEMFRLINYSNIQTGVDFHFGLYQWIAAGAILIGLTLLTADCLTRHKRKKGSIR